MRVTLTLLKRRGREQKAGGTETKDHGNPDCQPKGVPPYILGVSKGRGATINQSYHVISIKDICAIYPRKKNETQRIYFSGQKVGWSKLHFKATYAAASGWADRSAWRKLSSVVGICWNVE